MAKPIKRSITRPTSNGTDIGITPPLNKNYLCAHMCNCNNGSALISKSGQILKQRCVSSRIWVDEEINQLVWQYKAEVGFNMMKIPPAPLMSIKQPNRPSRFPLGRAMNEGLYIRDIEGRRQKGLLRIPDCIILKTNGDQLASMRASGTIDWAPLIPKQSNIELVVEIKFTGDTLSPEQENDYKIIAGRKGKFALLEYTDCNCKEKREPVKSPIHAPVVSPMPMASEEKKRWYKPSTQPTMAPAPQPIRPQYGPIVGPDEEGSMSMSSFLQAATLTGGVILVGLIALTPAGKLGLGAGLVVISGATRAENKKKGK